MINPEDSQMRRQHKLKRRTFSIKVMSTKIFTQICDTSDSVYRDQVNFGVWMDTINSSIMDLLCMGA